MQAREITEQRWHETARGAIHRPHSQEFTALAADPSPPLLSRIDLLQKAVRLAQDLFALRGDRDLARRAIKERDAEPVLELPDRAAERRREHLEPRRCPPEVHLLGRNDGAAQLAQVHRTLRLFLMII